MVARRAMREQTFLVLLALAGGERHGYGIMQEVTVLSLGSVELGPGTLYGALDRLTGEGLVEATRTEVVEGRQRRYYRLTEKGTHVTHEEADRRAQMADAARAKLRAAPGAALS
jgi:DNA-binding PadR family transcriptional regulator